jgi:MoaA/NifB/PqqE/SkfB family radical SAM enzyme
VFTNEMCNQSCAFCHVRLLGERASVADAEAVRARIDEAIAGGAREVVLTGGEPTRRRDLPAIVAYTKRAGAAEVHLETNGALLDEERVAALVRAGIGLARVHLPLWGEGCDAITGEAGGFSRTRAALGAFAAAGVPIEISAPIVRDNAAGLVELPAALAAEGLPVRALVLGFPTVAPDEDTLLPVEEAARAAQAVVAAARAVGLAVRIDPGALVPPCLFPQPSRVAHAFSLTPGGGARPDYAQLDGCRSCAVADRCPGIPRAALAREPGLTVRPIAQENLRRRLSVLSTVQAQIDRELVSRYKRRRVVPGSAGGEGEVLPESIIRVNFHCNQACRFCFVSTHLPPATHEAIVAAIEEIGRERGVLTLSGGEPTLNPRLEEYVRLGKRLGAREIELQTNATRLADGGAAAALVDAGVDTFFVSLHASTAAISDAITEAPGTFDKTVPGVDAIAKTRATLRLNYVFCERNQADFPDYVRLVAARWPTAMVNLSFVAASTDVVPRDRSLIPRYSELLPHVAEGVRLAHAAGLRLTGYESMCSAPLCQIPDDLSTYLDLAEIGPDVDRGDFLKVDACTHCAYDKSCYGVRPTYVELYGTSEFRPIAPRR